MKLAVVALIVGLTGVASADAPRQHRPRPLKLLLLKKFDRNGDGKLGPRERKHAAKALHKLANRLAKAPNNHRMQKRQKFIRRFDANGDGNVGPGEMPPGLADELRPLDRDGNGWLQGNELP